MMNDLDAKMVSQVRVRPVMTASEMGKIGGKRRAASLSKARLRAIAKMGGLARAKRAKKNAAQK